VIINVPKVSSIKDISQPIDSWNEGTNVPEETIIPDEIEHSPAKSESLTELEESEIQCSASPSVTSLPQNDIFKQIEEIDRDFDPSEVKIQVSAPAIASEDFNYEYNFEDPFDNNEDDSRSEDANASKDDDGFCGFSDDDDEGYYYDFNTDTREVLAADEWPTRETSAKSMNQLSPPMNGRREQLLATKALNELNVHDYFKKTDAQEWRLNNYLNYRLETENEIPTWTDVINVWKNSLETMIQTNHKKVPASVNSFCKELINFSSFEGESILKSCMEWYRDFYERYCDLQLAERAQRLEKNIYSSQGVSKLLRKKTNKKRSEKALDVLFDEAHEDELVESINKSILGEEITLPVSDDTSRQEFHSISDKFKKYRNKIPKTHRIITLGYWGVFDLTQESLYECKEFSQSEIDEISQDFANHIQWSPKPTPKNLQKYFDSNCDPVNLEDNEDKEKLHANIQFIILNMKKVGGKTEEELKFTTIYPLFNAVMDPSLIKDTWGEIQTLGSKDMRNDKANPFVKARMGRKVDMKGTLTKTSNKFEALYGEVSNGLSPLGISLASQKKKYLDKVKLAVLMRDSLNSTLKKWKHLNDEQRKKLIVYGWTLAGFDLSLYAMDWTGDGMYRFGLIENCQFPSNKENCGLFEGVLCLLKELEVVQELHVANTRGKCRQITVESSPILNLNRTPN
ncbi:776_t:CDS:10, partial [Ambispora leptoticha]